MAARTVKRLFDLEIDEVSTVDRSANQHADVAIAKRDEDGSMGIYDADGTPVDEQDLEHGDIVYTDDGQQVVFVEDGREADFPELFEAEGEHFADGSTGELQESGYAQEGELVGVGKSRWSAGASGTERVAGSALERVGPSSRARRASNAANTAVRRGGARVRNLAGTSGARYAGAGVAGAGVGYGVKKSLGESVYESLSKALTDGDRDEVIAKMADQVEVYKSQAEQAMSIAEELAYERELEQYTEIAKGYNLPGDPEDIAIIMKSAADTMDPAHVEYLDRMFSSVGEQLFATLGTDGGFPTSSVMGEVEALANQAISKADVSAEQAVVAIFEANPAAYDEYLQEG
jgi:hypothetical protein